MQSMTTLPSALPAAGPWVKLSAREQQVLQLIVDGHSTPEIAKVLYLSQNTVKVHVRNIFNKFGVNDRVQVVVQAFRSGIVH